MLLPILLGGLGVVISGIGSLSYVLNNSSVLCFICYGAAALLFYIANATRPVPPSDEWDPTSEE